VHTKILSENVEGRDHSEDMAVDELHSEILIYIAHFHTTFFEDALSCSQNAYSEYLESIP